MESLCIDFLNSDWRDWRGSGRREDRLRKTEWLQSFLEAWGLQAPLPHFTDDPQIAELVELRISLRRMVEAVARGEDITSEDLAELNRVMAMAPSHQRIELRENEYRLEQVSDTMGWNLVMARIVESFADLLVHQEKRRLKICDNQDCQWVYYDESRNRVRRWCDDKACGNLMKVRRFRERQKEKGEA
ncbi:ABATE domain-containing protein [Brevibacillus sp. AY1]|uniref:CGNR zinc finger domain-containing protein n=1 Tax=Brevibacillus sp. AY1 TaxID=2807621 RepID=UPI00245855C0|nr:ABATE domain-containing protein [Brevibacillus sp. AY1]MDH4620149.1 ABATE domain-containing protein [Brevibacillus sp. AY1]